MESYAKKIGALTDVELRVQRDQEGDDDFDESMKLQRHKAVVNDADDEDEWD